MSLPAKKPTVIATFQNALRVAGRLSEETGENYAVVATECPERPFKAVQDTSNDTAIVRYVS
jgi:hypothetical protein